MGWPTMNMSFHAGWCFEMRSATASPKITNAAFEATWKSTLSVPSVVQHPCAGPSSGKDGLFWEAETPTS